MSYPAEAPYLGQSGVQRVARGVELKAGESSGAVPVQRRESDGVPALNSFSGMRAVVRDPKPSGTRDAGGRAEPRRDNRKDLNEDEDGVAWQIIALAIGMLVLVGGFMAWKLGWLGGAAQSGLFFLLRLRPASAVKARRLLRPR